MKVIGSRCWRWYCFVLKKDSLRRRKIEDSLVWFRVTYATLVAMSSSFSHYKEVTGGCWYRALAPVVFACILRLCYEFIGRCVVQSLCRSVFVTCWTFCGLVNSVTTVNGQFPVTQKDQIFFYVKLYSEGLTRPRLELPTDWKASKSWFEFWNTKMTTKKLMKIYIIFAWICNTKDVALSLRTCVNDWFSFATRLLLFHKIHDCYSYISITYEYYWYFINL